MLRHRDRLWVRQDWVGPHRTNASPPQTQNPLATQEKRQKTYQVKASEALDILQASCPKGSRRAGLAAPGFG